jgi:hypothetical protein
MLNDPRVLQLLAAERLERLRADAAPTPAAQTSRRRPLRRWLALGFGSSGERRRTHARPRPSHTTS